MAPACLIHVFSWHATYQKLFPKYRIYWRPRRPYLKAPKETETEESKKKNNEKNKTKKTSNFLSFFFIFAFAVF